MNFWSGKRKCLLPLCTFMNLCYGVLNMHPWLGTVTVWLTNPYPYHQRESRNLKCLQANEIHKTVKKEFLLQSYFDSSVVIDLFYTQQNITKKKQTNNEQTTKKKRKKKGEEFIGNLSVASNMVEDQFRSLNLRHPYWKLLEWETVWIFSPIFRFLHLLKALWIK